MAEVTAQLNRLRIAPRKMRLLADLIRGRHVLKARFLLNFSVKRGSLPLRKLLDSAIANAKQNFQLEEKNLYIASITVDEGAKLKRWRARAKGRANRIEKKTSHIKIALKPGKALKSGWNAASIKKETIWKKEGIGKTEKTAKNFASAKDTAKAKGPAVGHKFFRRKTV